MQGITLVVPKEVSFNSAGAVEKLVLDNPSPFKLAVKIRTNHKTALHIHPTHDFIDPCSKKEVIVKLLQVHQGVKLQINYTIATQQMITKNDSKLTNVDKKLIKKQITAINVNEIANYQNKLKESIGSFGSGSVGVQSDFMTVVPQKYQNRQVQKKQSLNVGKKQPENMIVVEQKIQQDQEEFQEKQKKLIKGINQIEAKIVKKRQSILKKRAQSQQAIESGSILPPYAIPLVLILSYMVGSLLKSLIF